MTHMVSAALAFPPAGARTVDAPEVGTPEEGETGPPAVDDLPRRPLRFERSWPLQRTADRLARIHSRTWLTTWRWSGDHDEAQLIVGVLVDNAVRHAATTVPEPDVGLVLQIAEDDELVVDVSDPDPKFEGFDEVVVAARARADSGVRLTGIPLVLGLGGDITWGIPDVGGGKTVRVRMRPAAPQPPGA
ncbi:ATP-binding protein [Streptomyces justiciae]|uniref:ATP-binding protein n=1 Tax=Streptomyces justiciae TaxID=2780140 RepID=UPI002117FFCA|nr:ATP-binding protein [Streptomyces justiciae]MCW8379836.1 ATP-binding protein [Streptomyces justiciae]